MDFVTINGGAAGVVTIPASSAANFAQLQALVAAIPSDITINDVDPGSTAPPPEGSAEAVLTSSGDVTIPAGYSVVTGQGFGDVVAGTISGAQGAQIVWGSGGLTYTGGGAASIIATGGTNDITALNDAGTYPAAFIDVGGTSTVNSDNNLVWTEPGGSASVLAGTGNFVVTSGADTVTTGSGPNTVGAIGSVGGVTFAGSGPLLFVTGGDANGVQTIYGGTGAETVFAGPKSIDWEGASASGGLLFIGGPSASTINGGAGPETLFGGTGGDVFNLGSGGGTVVATSGSVTVNASASGADVFGNDGSNITYGGAGAHALVVDGGNETINAATSQGDNTFLVNAGNATLTGSDSGKDLFAIYKDGQNGGTITITNFLTGTDNLYLVGYGYNPDNVADGGALTGGPTQTVSGGADSITLSDGTTIVLQGVNTALNLTHYNAAS